jgi:fibronectin type 3 domain-containing protein
LTATAVKADADGDVVSLTFVWSVGATVVRTTAATASLTDTLDLALAGNGDKGQVVSVSVTPSDPATTGAAATASATVVNSVPTLASVSIVETSATTNTILHAATGTASDPDGDAVTIRYQWTKGGIDIAGATGPTLDLSLAGNGDKGQQIRVRATPDDGTTAGAAVTSLALTIANSGPSATVALDPASPDSNATLTATASVADADGDPVTLTYVWQVNGTSRKTTSNTTSLTDTLDLSVGGNGDPGDTVTVRVTPSDGTVSGAPASSSAQVVADTTAPAAPGTISATATSGAITLDWPDSVEHDLAGYRVSRATSASGPFTDITGTIATSGFTDTSATVGDLTYRVVAIDTTGNTSGASSIGVTRSIALRSVATAQATTASISVAKPTGAVAGDVLVAIIDVAGSAQVAAPSGWATVRSDTNGASLRQAVLSHVVGSEGGPYSFALSTAQGSSTVVAAYVGVDPVTPVDASSVGTGSGTSLTAPSVSAGDRSLLLMVSGIATSATIVPATGMIERAEIGSAGKTKLDAEFADQLRATAGATGTRTATASKAGPTIAQLVALRAAGASAPPPPSPTPPNAPTALSASAGHGTVDLRWTAPSDTGGAAITNYRIYRGSAASGESLLVQVGNTTTFQDAGLTNGTTYFYRVAAVNSAGEGPLSNEASATPGAAAVPGAPTGLTATPGKPRGIALSWTAPASDGGSPITAYEVWRGDAQGTETKLTTLGTATSYKDTTAIKGVTYWYLVKAVNAVGAGPGSTEASAIAR